MSSMIQSIRGMNDILPQQTCEWQFLEQSLAQIIHAYGYQELRFPIVESTTLFKRAIGEVTDIVEKEMYTFNDRNGDSLTLRPEGTAGCVRSCLQNGLLHNQTQRLWYMGPMYRHERPQKGRYRQFYQLGVEAFGFADPDIEVEMLLMNARFWRALGLDEQVSLQINTLGVSAERAQYRLALVDYLTSHEQRLDEDSRRRLVTNPLRVLDTKDAQVQQLLQQAPKLIDYLSPSSCQRFAKLCELLDKAGINFTINHKLVRGLDYYSHTVFEWVTQALGAQGTVCAGGRYDSLVAQLGGRDTAAMGFAVGLERLLMLMQHNNTLLATVNYNPDIYMIAVGEEANQQACLLAEKLRDLLPQLRIITNCGDGSIKSQFKRADKSGAEIAVIIGEEEAANHAAIVKFLRREVAQTSMLQINVAAYLQQHLVNTQ